MLTVAFICAASNPSERTAPSSRVGENQGLAETASRVEAAAGFFVAVQSDQATFAGVLMTCQSGFEKLLARELTEWFGLGVAEKGPGWVRLEEPPSRAGLVAPQTAFAHLVLMGPIGLRGGSVNALAGQVWEYFNASLREERIAEAWPSRWWGPAELVGLSRRIAAVEKAFVEILRKRLSRVAKLANNDIPRGAGAARGLFVFFADFDRLFAARDAYLRGARRMADDPLAPSRSYLKVEEACVMLGRAPGPGETVCDLGAAPGGWSYSAAKRGARVLAVDNGPLKGGALGHPQIEHRREDAFRFSPPVGERLDWLFCDLLEEPHHVLQHVVTPWLSRRWCRRFVINLKFGRVDPIALLGELRGPDSPLARHATAVRIQHLYHDREELTLAGEVKA